MIDLETKSVKKLVVELLAMVDLGLCSAAICDVSYGSTFTVMELTVFKPWLVGQAWEKRSDCKVTDCGSHDESCSTPRKLSLRLFP